MVCCSGMPLAVKQQWEGWSFRSCGCYVSGFSHQACQWTNASRQGKAHNGCGVLHHILQSKEQAKRLMSPTQNNLRWTQYPEKNKTSLPFNFSNHPHTPHRDTKTQDQSNHPHIRFHHCLAWRFEKKKKNALVVWWEALCNGLCRIQPEAFQTTLPFTFNTWALLPQLHKHTLCILHSTLLHLTVLTKYWKKCVMRWSGILVCKFNWTAEIWL